MFLQVVLVALVLLDLCPPLLPAISSQALVNRMYVSVLGGLPLQGHPAQQMGQLFVQGASLAITQLALAAPRVRRRAQLANT
jgi:hypothetical protein